MRRRRPTSSSWRRSMDAMNIPLAGRRLLAIAERRRITALLREAGWLVNVKRVERIWRQEGLKVPAKQPKRGRLWLNDGSCVRLLPERPNHVWSYDFVEDRTHNGRKFRMLNVIDEFTRECLCIRVDRKLRSSDVIDVLSDLFILRGLPGPHPFRQRSGVHRQGGAQMDRRGRQQNRLHHARLTLGEWVRRELQRSSTRRIPEWRDLLHTQGGADRDRRLEASLQRRAPTCIAGIPAAGTRGVRASVLRLAGCARPTNSTGQATRGGAAYRALTLPLDHSVEADQHSVLGR
ncbi:UNVERIFIED_ORG: hypothetical protein M2438_003715 [Methylobacterium sp. SuP10 SLI 274]|nr:hypothetical protein [Methylobacterium sp. SuP10 SLI 274]